MNNNHRRDEVIFSVEPCVKKTLLVYRVHVRRFLTKKKKKHNFKCILIGVTANKWCRRMYDRE